MKTLPIDVGLDYHQGSIQTCAIDQDGTVLANRKTASSIEGVVSVLTDCGPVRAVAIESCCGAAEFGEALRKETGWSVKLAHPGYVNRMKLNPDKSDFSDARILADLSRAGYLPEVWLAPRAIRELRTLTRRRQHSVDRRKATKLRVSALLRTRRIRAPKGVRAWTKCWMVWISEVEFSKNDRWVINSELADIEHDTRQIERVQIYLQRLTQDDPLVVKLRSLPGIGPITAWMMRAEIGDFSRFRNGKQLARFCGTTPRNCSSGERVVDSGLIRAGNPQFKAIIIQAAHRLVRTVPRWIVFADRLARAGKPRNVIIAAVANRWIRSLFHKMKEFPAAV